jgi:NDP-sugar pyrophosphorylase family protein
MRTVVIPMAGKGSRLTEYGAKVLLPVRGIPMFLYAIDTLGFQFDRLILVTRKEHEIPRFVQQTDRLPSDLHIVELDHDTEGPLCSVLKAYELLQEKAGDELVIANSDQVMVWPGDWALAWFRNRGAVGGIPLIGRASDRHSYARMSSQDPRLVVEVREKQRISEFATIGVYWFRSVSVFLDAAYKAISANDRAPNGEFYVSLVYNHIEGTVLWYPLCEFWSLGEKENIRAFLNDCYEESF